jgi:HTH-type transcriptional regulator / antitoxin HigA
MSAIRPIKTEQDYELALARVDEIFDAEPDTAEGDELDVLTTLVEAYEEDRFPVGLPSAIAAIKFRMEQEDLSQADLKPYIGSSAKVSEILSGKRQLTLKMVRALNEHLGIPADVLIRSGTVPDNFQSIDWQRFPLAEMAKLGWIPSAKDIKDRAEEIMRDLIERAGGCNALGFALYRKNDASRKNAKTNPYALKAWCIYVLAKARETTLDRKYIPGTVTLEFLREVAKLSSQDGGPKLAQEFLAEHGIALVIAQRLKNTHLDGAAMITAEGRPVIGVTLRYDRIDNFWFCLLHELAHLGRHIDNGQGEFFVDDLTLAAGEDPREKEADEWAEEGLIPAELWDRHPVRTKPSGMNIISLAGTLQIHPAIVAGRVRHERKNYNLFSHFVGQGEVSKHLSFA